MTEHTSSTGSGAETDGQPRYCPGCGRPVRPGSQFCTGCGRATSPVQSMVPPPVPAGRRAGQKPVQKLRRGRGRVFPTAIGAVVGTIALGGIAAGVIFVAKPFGPHKPVASTATIRPRASAPAGPGASAGPDIASNPASSPAGLTGAAGSTGSASPSGSSGTAAERQAAVSLSALLSQSGGERDQVNAAFNDVGQCGPDIAQDVQTFQDAATSHKQLLSQLDSVPGLQSLPQPMITDLRAAWQASASADSDFARWAQDQLGDGCSPDNQTDPNYEAANGPDVQATASKTAFVQLWNPLATSYGLPTYSQGDL